MSRSTSEPLKTILYAERESDLQVKVHLGDNAYIYLDFRIVAVIEGDRLVVRHGVEVSAYSATDKIPYMRGKAGLSSTGLALYANMERVCEVLGLEISSSDGIMLRAESPATAIATLNGYGVEVLYDTYDEIHWEPEVVIPRFVEMHLRLTHLLMGVASFANDSDMDWHMHAIHQVETLMGVSGLCVDNLIEMRWEVDWLSRVVESLVGVQYARSDLTTACGSDLCYWSGW